MEIFDSSHAPAIRDLLEQRETQLRALLQAPDQLRELAEGDTHEVADTKDLAGEQSEIALGEAMSDHAARELGQTQAALRRLAEGSYGRCLDCGEAIDLRRLTALPATPFCIRCQLSQESQNSGPARH